METHISLPVPNKPRQSQAERTAGTRKRIVEAVVDSIADVGFQRTTAQEITKRAGVTWGAVNHHFGGKDGILAAVLESSFQHFVSLTDSIPRDGLSLEDRAGRFVEQAWLHFGDARYASTFQILINHAPIDADAESPRWQDTMANAWDSVWRDLFGDAPIPSERLQALERYSLAVLSGMATARMMQGPNPSDPVEELAMLRGTLVRELTR